MVRTIQVWLALSTLALAGTGGGAFARDDEELVGRIESIVLAAADADRFSGTVLVARGEKVVIEMALGEASKRYHVDNNIDTKFNLGSMNKMFTAVSVGQLVEKGLVSYDDPISKYVDASWLPREITDAVTVFHLLTHTSGLGSYFNSTYFASSRRLFHKVDDYKPLVQGDTLAFQPGARFSYSNTGMLLLGVVIEKASGQDYFDYVREHIYAPAGMENTDCYEMDQPIENLAIGYEPDETSATGWRNNLYQHVIMGGPAGGGFSTVRDLHRFALALLDGKLVNAETREFLWTDHAGANYGCGFGVHTGPTGRVVGHGGGFAGISSNLDILVDDQTIIAVMSNYGGGTEGVRGPIRALFEERAE